MNHIYLVIGLMAMSPISLLWGQCECEALPAPQGTVETVSSAAALNTALKNADANRGNYTILLEDGVYELKSDLHYIGKHVPNLTVRSKSGNRDQVIIKGEGIDGGVGWIFNIAAEGFTLADVTIGWVTNHAIQIHSENDADNSLIQNVRFVNTGNALMKISGSEGGSFSDNGIVQCCTFEFTEQIISPKKTGGIEAHRAKDWTIRYNTFMNINTTHQSYIPPAILFWSASENTTIENNLIGNCAAGIRLGWGGSPHYRGTIKNNIVHSHDLGIGVEFAPESKIFNNTVITEKYWNSIEYRFEGTYNAEVYNNLTNKAIKRRNRSEGIAKHNFEQATLDMFVAPASYNFHLKAPVEGIVDAGIQLDEVQVDFDCNLRADNDMPDIGADEFQQTVTSVSEGQKTEVIIALYPNPATSHINIENREAINLELLNTKGQQLRRFELEAGTNRLSVIDLPEGVYFLRVINPGKETLKRVMISQ